MTDHYFMSDLLASVKKDTTPERYWPLIGVREELLSFLHEKGIVRRPQMTADVLDEAAGRFGNGTARLLAGLMHIYDFNPAKLKDIRQYEGTERYEPLRNLLRLPGVQLLRAELYHNSGVSLQTLTVSTTEEIREAVAAYIAREGRSEIVPLPKEINCHREAARLFLRGDAEYDSGSERT